MITDTALFRYPPYHTAEDTPDKIVYKRMARVVSGLRHIVGDLAEMPPESGSDRLGTSASDRGVRRRSMSLTICACSRTSFGRLPTSHHRIGP